MIHADPASLIDGFSCRQNIILIKLTGYEESFTVENRSWQVEKKVLTISPHCAVGCQYYLIVKDGKIVDTEAYNGPYGMWCESSARTE